MADTTFETPGLGREQDREAAEILQDRLYALIDLSLVLKHVHWNVVGRDFIGVHKMIDPHVEEVRAMVDQTAERIAILGGSPDGRAASLVEGRSWDDYDLRRAETDDHLRALDRVYVGLLSSHREAIERTGDIDPVTEDLLIGQMHQLELFHWFVRAHLETPDGQLPSGDGNGAAAARRRTPSRTARRASAR